MKIRYGLHFSLLAVSAVVFWFARNFEFYLLHRISDFRFTFFGLMGALHAISVVVALRDLRTVRPIKALCFVALAALWSAVTPILGFWCSIIWAPVLYFLPASPHNFAFLLLTGSVIGSLGYWTLVRFFWMKLLRCADWLRTIVCCAAGTLFSFATCQFLPSNPGVDYDDVTWLVLTVGWWVAFSVSLYWSETRRNPAVGLAEAS